MEITLDLIRRLPVLSCANLTALPADPALYFVLDAQLAEVLYIGATINLRHRWMTHNKKFALRRYDYVVAWRIEADPDVRRTDEMSLIGKYNPSLNKKGRQLVEPKYQIQAAVPLPLKRLLESKAAEDDRTVSHVVRRLLEESPTIKAWQRKINQNGHGTKKGRSSR
jgi:hypothetical protein